MPHANPMETETCDCRPVAAPAAVLLAAVGACRQVHGWSMACGMLGLIGVEFGIVLVRGEFKTEESGYVSCAQS